MLSTQQSNSNMCSRPVSAYGKNKRPQSAYAKMVSQVNGNPRYRHDNILQIEIDLPIQTTYDYVSGGHGLGEFLKPELALNGSGGGGNGVCVSL